MARELAPSPRRSAHTPKQFPQHFAVSKTVPVTRTSPSPVTFLYGKMPSPHLRLLRYTLTAAQTAHHFRADVSYAALSWIRIHGETTTAHKLGSRSSRSNARVADTSPRLPEASQAETLSRWSSAMPSAASIKSRPASTHNRAPLAKNGSSSFQEISAVSPSSLALRVLGSCVMGIHLGKKSAQS